MFVLDTNVISELRQARSGRAHPKVTAWAEQVPPGQLFVSVVTILELEIGVRLLERRDAAQGSELRAWMDQRVLPAFADRILAVDTTVALRCAARPAGARRARRPRCRHRARARDGGGHPKRLGLRADGSRRRRPLGRVGTARGGRARPAAEVLDAESGPGYRPRMPQAVPSGAPAAGSPGA